MVIWKNKTFCEYFILHVARPKVQSSFYLLNRSCVLFRLNSETAVREVDRRVVTCSADVCCLIFIPRILVFIAITSSDTFITGCRRNMQTRRRVSVPRILIARTAATGTLSTIEAEPKYSLESAVHIL